MKLKTSFFKPETLRKDILRFAPIWVMYLVGMLLLFMETGSYDRAYDRFAANLLPEMVMVFGVVNLGYAAVVANLLFGDLYNTKLCYSLHAMPYRRESWLLTHILSGLLFSLVPNCFAALYLMVQLEDYWVIGLLWLLAVTLQYLFFYGIATMSAMLTGNRFAMLLVYAGFNFVAMLLYATVQTIYIPMLRGVMVNMESSTIFSPVVQLFEYDFFTFTRESYVDYWGDSNYFYRYDGLGSGWGYTAILGAVGLAAMGLSFLLYRLRHLESAGDFIAFPRLKGIACVIMTLCVALCFALAGELWGSYIPWLIIGFIVGYFGSLMLLERRLKVFRKNTLTGFGVLAFVVVLSLIAVQLDWLGIEGWTPKADKVASVTVSNSTYEHCYNYLDVKLEDEAEIAEIIAAHEEFVEIPRGNHANQTQRVVLTYKMKSGRTVIRYYDPSVNSKAYGVIRKYLYNTESILGFTDAKEAAENVSFMYSSMGNVPSVLQEKLLRALQLDCEDGYVYAEADGKSEWYLEYRLEQSDGTFLHRSVHISSKASRVREILESVEMQMGYGDWDSFLINLTNVSFSNDLGPVERADWNALLKALRRDIEAGHVAANVYTENVKFYLWYEIRWADGEQDYREWPISEKTTYVLQWLKENGKI